MNTSRLTALQRAIRKIAFRLVVLSLTSASFAQDAQILQVENIVQAAKGATSTWAPATNAQSLAIGDRIRTRQKSRATVRLTDLYTMRMEQYTTIELSPKLVGGGRPQLDIVGGAAFIFSREDGAEIGIKTPAANATLKGTQLFVQVSGGRSQFQVIEGSVEMRNDHGQVLLNAGEAGEATPGQAPIKTAAIQAKNILQWALYYPAVIDPSELAMGAAEELAVAASLAAYREGDLLGALEKYPDRSPHNTGGRLYQAGVLLAVGRVDETAAILHSIDASAPGRRALERMIAEVNGKPSANNDAVSGVAGELAESYYQQSHGNLEAALAAARRATDAAPQNGYAWTRVAELEFSFGRTKAARQSLERGLSLTPKNAQSHALHGFILSAENRIREAHEAFGEAIRLDGALGNAWLGRGLVRIKSGHFDEGRTDLQTAATVEPTSAIFHSYLGKAFSAEGRTGDAHKDLNLAKRLDPNDPTPWLYSAVQNQQENRYNKAIGDLDESIRLNDNRRLYRSQLLLDQDRAVRSANLARIYQNAGMKDVAVREASHAVESDYTNASSHLFLANSVDALRDPTRTTLRYETAWFNELLLAHLLSPVGGGPLSQFVSQEEYSKLLEADGFTGSTTTDYRGDGQLLNQSSLSGTFGNLSFGLDYEHFDDNGHRPNNAVSRETVYWQAKYQATPDDMFYTFGQWQNSKSGDLFQSYSDKPLSLRANFEEKQEPGQLIFGWNHRWAPGVHTLLLGARLAADQTLTDPSTTQLLLNRATTPELERFFNGQPAGAVTQNPDGSLAYSDDFLAGIEPFTGRGMLTTRPDSEQFSFETQRQFEIYSGEIQQIWETDRNTLIAGGRWQDGSFETTTRLTLLDPTNQFLFSSPAADQHESVDFDRSTVYLYDFVKMAPWLTLIGGVSWDRIEYPENFRSPPVSPRAESSEHWSGKAGFTLSPSRRLRIRGVYSEGMGGVSFEDSVRLEPVQLAGFNQSFRTIISESLAGSVEAPFYKNAGISIEGELPTQTWWGASFNVLNEEVHRTIGAFDGFSSPLFPVGFGYVPGGTKQSLSYQEKVFTATLNQILGEQFALGATYRFTTAELQADYPQLAALAPEAKSVDDGTLHELRLSAVWNSPGGLFARSDARWYSQGLDALPGDNFWQFDAAVGYRFQRSLCDVSVGVLNITDKNYQLSPLTYTSEIPRERTAFVRLRLSF